MSDSFHAVGNFTSGKYTQKYITELCNYSFIIPVAHYIQVQASEGKQVSYILPKISYLCDGTVL